MRTELIYWIVSAPFGIILISALLTEALGVPDVVAEVVVLLLLVVFVLSLVLIVVTLARRPAESCDEFFRENSFTIQNTRLFGRRYHGTWKNVAVEVRFLVGAGGIPSQLEARNPPQEAWIANTLTPVLPDQIAAWLDRITDTSASQANG